MKTLLTPEELDDCLADVRPDDPEYQSLKLLQDLYYLQEEGFLEIEDEHLYPVSDA